MRIRHVFFFFSSASGSTVGGWFGASIPDKALRAVSWSQRHCRILQRSERMGMIYSPWNFQIAAEKMVAFRETTRIRPSIFRELRESSTFLAQKIQLFQLICVKSRFEVYFSKGQVSNRRMWYLHGMWNVLYIYIYTYIFLRCGFDVLCVSDMSCLQLCGYVCFLDMISYTFYAEP